MHCAAPVQGAGLVDNLISSTWEQRQPREHVQDLLTDLGDELSPVAKWLGPLRGLAATDQSLGHGG